MGIAEAVFLQVQKLPEDVNVFIYTSGISNSLKNI